MSLSPCFLKDNNNFASFIRLIGDEWVDEIFLISLSLSIFIFSVFFFFLHFFEQGWGIALNGSKGSETVSVFRLGCFRRLTFRCLALASDSNQPFPIIPLQTAQTAF